MLVADGDGEDVAVGKEGVDGLLGIVVGMIAEEGPGEADGLADELVEWVVVGMLGGVDFAGAEPFKGDEGVDVLEGEIEVGADGGLIVVFGERVEGEVEGVVVVEDGGEWKSEGGAQAAEDGRTVDDFG